MNNFTRNDQGYSEAYQEAEKRVKAKNGFKWHLAGYLMVNIFLIGIYLITCWNGNNWNWSYPWFIWVLGGWGIGLAFDFLGVYVFLDNNVTRQKMINKEMQQMGVSTPNYTPGDQTSWNPQPERPLPEPALQDPK